MENNKIFSTTQINTGRQLEFDLIKTICIVLMIYCHIFEELIYNKSKLAFCFIDILPNFNGALSFMIIMGSLISFSKKNKASDLIKRGFLLLTLGFLFNFIAIALPNFVTGIITNKQYFINKTISLIGNDIFQFAGLAFITMGLLYKLKPEIILLIAFIANIINYIISLKMPSPSNYIINQFVGYIIKTDSESYFPLLSYFVFTAFGYYLGKKYVYIQNKDKLANISLITLLPLCIIWTFFRINYKLPFFEYDFFSLDTYQLKPGLDAIFGILYFIILLSICYKISKYLKPKIMAVFSHFSSNLTKYYVTSYGITLILKTILLATIVKLFPNDLMCIIFGFILIPFCYIIITFYKYFMEPKIKQFSSKTKFILCISIWILTFVFLGYTNPKITEYPTYKNDYLIEEIIEKN